jgi:AraC-like DNA-binding protein
MAEAAGMSRSAFAAEFKLHLGVTPAEYLLQWRIALAQSMLLAGSPIKLASEKLGYASAASFSRAFAQSVGLSPRAWLQDRQA